MKKILTAGLVSLALVGSFASPASAVSSYCLGDKHLANTWNLSDFSKGTDWTVIGYVKEWTSARCGTVWAEGWLNNGGQINVTITETVTGDYSVASGTGHQTTGDIQYRYGTRYDRFASKAAKPGIHLQEWS